MLANSPWALATCRGASIRMRVDNYDVIKARRGAKPTTDRTRAELLCNNTGGLLLKESAQHNDQSRWLLTSSAYFGDVRIVI